MQLNSICAPLVTTHPNEINLKDIVIAFYTWHP